MASGIARLIDVARRSGLSVATVSRHLNNKIKLPDDTVAAIEGAIRELGYQPNPHARSLSRGRSDTIGLVIPDIGNPYFARLAAAVEAAAHEQGLALVLCVTLNQRARELEYLSRLGRNYLDGLIFLTNHPCDRALAAAINQTHRRVVILDEDVKGARGHKVFGDNARGGYLAGRHLVEQGHRRIAFLGGPEAMLSTRDRLAGCQQAMAEHAPRARLTTVAFGAYAVAHGRDATAAILRKPDAATAIFASSDEIAIGALEACASAGIRIPEQLSVVGFDDIAPFHLFHPPLTCVRQPVEAIGRRAVELLVCGLAGTRMRAAVECLPVQLIVRDSVAPPLPRGKSSLPYSQELIDAHFHHA